MTDMRRTVLLVVFTMSLVLLWDGWQKYNGHPSMFAPARHPVAAAGSNPGNPASSAPAALAGAAAGNAALAAAPGASAPAVSQLVTITTDLFKATLDTRGGTLTRLELLKQIDNADPSGHVVILDTSATRFYQAQSGLAGVAGAPTHLTVMNLVSSERELKEGASALTLRFESPEEAGLKLSKTYTFKRGDYVIGVKHEIANVSSAPLSPQLYLQLERDGYVPKPVSKMAPSAFTGPALYTDKQKFDTLSFADIDKGKLDFAPDANDGWIAMLQNYFASAWLHQAPGERGFSVKPLPGTDSPHYAISMVFRLPEIAPGASVSTEDQLFVGPESEKLLDGLAPGFELTRNYGFWSIIAKPLFWLLDHLHDLIGNWGWSIVALVVLLKIAFFGLNAKAFKSMAKMKALNPKIQEMRERLKDKPQEMQQAMMRIYKEEGVNPLGSCLPILVQMPIFLALYQVLLHSVEMRHAPWMGWITDLSVQDPFYILPVIYTCTSLLQTWLNPTPADPVQAKMMWFMPLAFSVMFLFFPSGLVLYWVTNNLLTIAQQWLINKKLGVRN